MPKYIDIHCHTNFIAFKDDGDEVIDRALNNDTWLINVGSQYSTSERAVLMTNKYKKGVYASIGLHPIHLNESYHDDSEIGGKGFTSRAEIFDKEKYRNLTKEGKVVAIGECGLDYYHLDKDNIEKQKEVFIEQIELANELNIPLMLHIRNGDDKSKNAYFDVCELLKKHSKVKGVSHFFAGSVEDMKRLVELGFYISFAGPITYPRKPEICDYEEVILQTPLDKILTDTDSPYVAPVPYRGKRNEPVYVKEIVKKIAKIKGLSEEEMSKIIFENANRLFSIG